MDVSLINSIALSNSGLFTLEEIKTVTSVENSNLGNKNLLV